MPEQRDDYRKRCSSRSRSSFHPHFIFFPSSPLCDAGPKDDDTGVESVCAHRELRGVRKEISRKERETGSIEHQHREKQEQQQQEPSVGRGRNRWERSTVEWRQRRWIFQRVLVLASPRVCVAYAWQHPQFSSVRVIVEEKKKKTSAKVNNPRIGQLDPLNWSWKKKTLLLCSL